MFEGFETSDIETAGAVIRTLKGGDGPPLLLLHGNPLTHVHWHKLAPRLARHFTVIATDLRGYGDSSKPPGGPDHDGYSFRAMAEDQIAVMAHFGFERFHVAGHDRGARVGHRMALDRPDVVARLAVIEILPTLHVLSDISKEWAANYYHWFFLAQPHDFPERLLSADPAYYIRKKLNKPGVGLAGFTDEALAEYIRCCTPENIHAVCEDYRATLGVDFDRDAADFDAGRRIQCPALVIWGAESFIGRHSHPPEAWAPWLARPADAVYRAVPGGHYPAEQSPDQVLAAFLEFFPREPLA